MSVGFVEARQRSVIALGGEAVYPAIVHLATFNGDVAGG